MGRAKEMAMDIDECKYSIEVLLTFLQNVSEDNVYFKDKKECIEFLNTIRSSIVKNWNEIEFVNEELQPILSFVSELDNEKISDGKRSSIEFLVLKSIITARNNYYHNSPRIGSRKISGKFSTKAINSSSFYTQKINELNIERASLEEELQKTKGNLTENSEKTLELEQQVENIKIELEDQKTQLEIRTKEDDAKSSWEDKINLTFTSLKGYLKPITDEQKRLKQLFGIYSILSSVLVIFLVVIECIAICKVAVHADFPDFKKYLTIFLPLPVAGGLLWGFIFQLNRAQRQLVVIAKSIHSVEYVQGLLLAINNLSPSIEDAIIRINSALDKLIDNHLSQEDVSTESGLVKEENKDSLPIDSVLKILKEAKGFVKK